MKKNTTQFTVYPNPANDYTSIAISLDKTEKVILTIVDLLGKEISKEEKELLLKLNESDNFKPKLNQTKNFFDRMKNRFA